MAKKNKADELTTAMHAEFRIDQETDLKHLVWTALDAIGDGDMTQTEALQEYGITENDLITYKAEWLSLRD